MVHKLLLLRTPTRKSRRVWEQEISGLAPGLLFRRDLSIIEAEIHSENVEHPCANGVELRPVGKWSLLNLHSFEEEASFANWVHLFESRCITSLASTPSKKWATTQTRALKVTCFKMTQITCVLVHYMVRRKVNVNHSTDWLSISSIHRLGTAFDFGFMCLGNCAGHVAWMVERRCVYSVSVRKSEVKRPLGWLRRRW